MQEGHSLCPPQVPWGSPGWRGRAWCPRVPLLGAAGPEASCWGSRGWGLQGVRAGEAGGGEGGLARGVVLGRGKCMGLPLGTRVTHRTRGTCS